MKEEQEFIDYFIVTDEWQKVNAPQFTFLPQFSKKFDDESEAKRYMAEQIINSPMRELNFSMRVGRKSNPKYKLAEKIEELEKELAEKKELMEELWR